MDVEDEICIYKAEWNGRQKGGRVANVLMMICLHEYARVRMTIDCRLASEALRSKADSAEISGRNVRLLAQLKMSWKENAMKPNKAENEQSRNPRRLCTTDL